ncbi:MAG: hypothetical protein PUP92_23600 [Rhizonema sp. PD38]|nr:hypothetical protein [Rhizonema sp. PD38]
MAWCDRYSQESRRTQNLHWHSSVTLYTQGDRQQGLAMGEAALRIDKSYGNLDVRLQVWD